MGPYEAVYAHPEGEATVARQVKTAAEYGFEGVVVRTREAEYDPGTLAGRHGVDVVRGVEIDADDPQGASGAVGNFRGDCTVLLVRGGTDALNRFAVEQDRVDVLARPFDGTGDVNHVLVKAAVAHDVRIEFDLGAVLRDDGGSRVRRLRKLRKLRELVDYFDAPYVVSATPASHLRMRAPRDLAAVGEQIGFGADAVREGLAEWGRLAARNRERRADSFISPGVQRGRYEE
ncbi:RNase P subunit p30 family protein [Halolamina rubra]|uniref:RNase P subunit p30 family protein n=1 Tax=Halolamina rubra TaxID=1380430 RepID=UPI00067966EB|nr:RNase P subunit p30 family protein [Halolamina rubra]